VRLAEISITANKHWIVRDSWRLWTDTLAKSGIRLSWFDYTLVVGFILYNSLVGVELKTAGA